MIVAVDSVIRDTRHCYGNRAFAPEKVTKDHELLIRVKFSSEGQIECILLPILTHTHTHNRVHGSDSTAHEKLMRATIKFPRGS